MQSNVSLRNQLFKVGGIGYNGRRLRNVGHIEAFNCESKIKVNSRKIPCLYEDPPHVFLGAVCALNGEYSSFK